MLRVRVLLPAAAAILAALTASAHASTITVNTTFDELNPGDGMCSLREAIAAVNSPAAANGDCAAAAFGANTIKLSAGTYRLTIAPTGSDDNSTGDLNIAGTVSDLTIVGSGEGSTIVDASGLGDRILTVSRPATVTLQDLTLTGGHAPGGAPAAAGAAYANGGAPGGAIDNDGILTLDDMAITNSAAGDGGSGAAGTAASPAGGQGGGGGDGGAINNTNALTLEGVTLSGDSAGNGGAGGAGASGSGTTGGNGGVGGAGGSGGAIAGSGNFVTITDSTIRGDQAGAGGPGGAGGAGSKSNGVGGAGGRGGDGGGEVGGGGGTVTNVTFAGDSAGPGGTGGNGAYPGAAGGDGGNGGAIADYDAGSTIVNATIVGNAAGNPGPAGSAPGGAAQNGADGAGGGIFRVSGPAMPFAQYHETQVQNTLLAFNTGGACAGVITDMGHNLSWDDATCPPGFATGDPKLGPLQDNGGPAPTISLGSGSAAINAVPSTGAGCPSTDERGVHRPSGSACDIGAYEVAPPTVTTEGTTNIGLTGVTLTASVAANAASGTVDFQYGTSTNYGTQTGTVTVNGVAPENTQIDVRHLKPNTVYHFRAVATAMDGTTYGPDETFLTTPPPVLSHVRIAPHRFRALRHGPSIAPHGGARVSYRDSEAATVAITVRRIGSGGQTRRVGSFRHHDRTGHNRWRFSGRVRGRALRPGRYELTLTPRFARQPGRPVSVTFTITA